MSTSTRNTIAALVALILFAVTGLGQEEPSGSGTITGQVLNENGQPLPNAVVFARGSAPFFQQRSATTDSDGRFRIAGLDPLLYGLAVSAPSYVTPPRDSDSPPAYYRVGDTVTLNLIKGGVISGSVLNSAGEPAVQIGVRAVMIRDARGEVPRFSGYQSQKTTDDRGIYRLYGLVPGTYVVSTLSKPSFAEVLTPFDGEAPTYAPSSSRDTAAEITVRPGEETSGVDIRHRGEAGRIVSGKVVGTIDPQSTFVVTVNLMQTIGGSTTFVGSTFQRAGGEGFAFHGVPDGEYDVAAQYFTQQGEAFSSEPRRVIVKGADVAGVEIAIRPLGAIEGRVSLVKSDAVECKDKRQPLFAETLVIARLNEKSRPKDQLRPANFFFAQGSPNPAGDFRLRNLTAGLYNINTRFFARYWYLRSVTAGSSTPATIARTAVAKRPDVARDGITLKAAERFKDLTITLAEGAGSLRGKIMRDAGVVSPPNLKVHLVPVEKEHADDSLRYFASPVQADGTFALNNLPPGNYWVLARTPSPNDSLLESKAAEALAQLRRAAEATKNTVDFKPCQNVTGYSLPF